jgi:hypothetical protein
MNVTRLAVVSLLVTGCASSSRPTALEAASFRPVARPVVQKEQVASSDDPESALVGLASAWRAAAQDQPARPANPHSFGGGLGVRVRGNESALDLYFQYQYYVNQPVRIGAIADWAASPIDSLLVAPAVWWNATDRLTLLGAPGLELMSGDGTELALRVGAAYRLMLEKLAIRPFAFWDLVQNRDDSVVFGIAISN